MAHLHDSKNPSMKGTKREREREKLTIQSVNDLSLSSVLIFLLFN